MQGQLGGGESFSHSIDLPFFLFLLNSVSSLHMNILCCLFVVQHSCQRTRTLVKLTPSDLFAILSGTIERLDRSTQLVTLS